MLHFIHYLHSGLQNYVSYIPSYKPFIRVELLILLLVIAISVVSQASVVINVCLILMNFSLFPNNTVAQKQYWCCVAY